MRWLAVPPALALLLMFGPWRGSAPRASEPSTAQGSSRSAEVPTVASPDLTQVACTMLGVCLLGIAVVVGIKRARARTPSTGTAVVLRQSLRLSNRHSVHALEFADRLLLLGECEGSLRVLHTGVDPDLAPAAHKVEPPPAEDEGAVLKDMVLPRPSQPGGAAARLAASERSSRGLKDFRTLLGKTQVHA
jgi:hypothetical protein